MKKTFLFLTAALTVVSVFAQEPPTVSTAELSMRYCDAPVEEDVNVKIDINTTYEWEGSVYSETGNYTKILQDNRGCDRIVTLHLKVRTNPTGTIDGLFSVSANKQVYFAKGNLQHNVANVTDGPWWLLNNQWTSGKTFQFGTSGYQYDPDGSGNSNYLKQVSLTQTNHDWGWYNSIKNGGNAPHIWYTMSKDEFNYVINSRSSSLKAFKSVHSQGGMILLPDVWNWSDVVVGGVPMTDWPAGNIDDETWAAMEDNGAVFFKAGTYWTGTDPGSSQPGNPSCYSSNGWTYYLNITNNACTITFKELNYGGDDKRQVRLVRNSQ